MAGAIALAIELHAPHGLIHRLLLAREFSVELFARPINRLKAQKLAPGRAAAPGQIQELLAQAGDQTGIERVKTDELFVLERAGILALPANQHGLGPLALVKHHPEIAAGAGQIQDRNEFQPAGVSRHRAGGDDLHPVERDRQLLEALPVGIEVLKGLKSRQKGSLRFIQRQVGDGMSNGARGLAVEQVERVLAQTPFHRVAARAAGGIDLAHGGAQRQIFADPGQEGLIG